MAILQDDAARAKRRRRTEDRADVLGSGHLIQHQQKAGGGIREFVQGEGLDKGRAQGDPLMRRAGRQKRGDGGAFKNLHRARGAEVFS